MIARWVDFGWVGLIGTNIRLACSQYFYIPWGRFIRARKVVEFIPFHCVIIYIQFVTLSIVNRIWTCYII